MLKFLDRYINDIIMIIGFIFAVTLAFVDLGSAGLLIQISVMLLMLLGLYNEIPDVEYRTDHDELWKLASRSN